MEVAIEWADVIRWAVNCLMLGLHPTIILTALLNFKVMLQTSASILFCRIYLPDFGTVNQFNELR